MSIEITIKEQEIAKILKEFSNLYSASEYSRKEVSPEEIAGMIDHTLLKPEASEKEIEILCNEALNFNFASVCVNPCNVELCSGHLKSSNVKVCTVVGFPLGATTTETKYFEAKQAIKNGADEIDMVINIGRLKDQDYQFVFNDIKSISELVKNKNRTLKVIIETCLLTDYEKIIACLIAKKAGADFVKTSTGFSKGGATIRDVALMKFVVGDKLKVKASGGIRTYDDASNMINAGASRLGASAGVKIISGQKSEGNY